MNWSLQFHSNIRSVFAHNLYDFHFIQSTISKYIKTYIFRCGHIRTVEKKSYRLEFYCNRITYVRRIQNMIFPSFLQKNRINLTINVLPITEFLKTNLIIIFGLSRMMKNILDFSYTKSLQKIIDEMGNSNEVESKKWRDISIFNWNFFYYICINIYNIFFENISI